MQENAKRLSTARRCIREARASDLDALMALEDAAFASDRLSRRAMRHAVHSPTQIVLVLIIGEDLAAAAIAGLRAGSAMARISSIAVSRTFAGEGLGHQLLEASEQRLRRHGIKTVRLEVRDDNAAAIRLYERSGYTQFGHYDDYYEDGASALRFQKSLT